MSRARPCSRRVCGGAGPTFLKCQRGPRFTFLCCQKGKAQVFRPQLLARTRRQLGFSACNCWADHSDDTTGGKSLPATSVFLTVILCPGTNDISPPPTRARGLPIQRERFLSVNNHFLGSQCSLLMRGRRKTVVALFIPIPHTRIRLECSRRGEGTLLVLLLKDAEPTYHAESERSLRHRHPPMTRRLTRALTFYWLRMAHSWRAFRSPSSGPPSLGDCHSTALGQSGELPGGGLPASSSPSPPVPRPPSPHPSPLPAGL